MSHEAVRHVLKIFTNPQLGRKEDVANNTSWATGFFAWTNGTCDLTNSKLFI